MQQVEGIMRGALEPDASSTMQGDVPVQVVVEVARFHALTERARYTTADSMRSSSSMSVRHAETGAILSGPEPVDLTFRGYGGRRAVEAEQQGITQRVRISEQLVGWARGALPGDRRRTAATCHLTLFERWRQA
jgi:hypothetical protein